MEEVFGRASGRAAIARTLTRSVPRPFCKRTDGESELGAYRKAAWLHSIQSIIKQIANIPSAICHVQRWLIWMVMK